MDTCSLQKMVTTRVTKPYIACNEEPHDEFLNIKQTKQDWKIVSVEEMQW